jgi:hypothetical protein
MKHMLCNNQTWSFYANESNKRTQNTIRQHLHDISSVKQQQLSGDI